MSLLALSIIMLIMSSCSGKESNNSRTGSRQSSSEAQENTESSSNLILEQALSTAYNTSVLTQSAQTADDWKAIQQGWQDAINQLSSIPDNSEQYPKAQQKITEYQTNLAYASEELAKAIKFSDPVSITLTVEQAPNGRASVLGDTNLPNGSVILISMQNNLGANSQDKVLVSDGQFSTMLGPAEGLVTARYVVDAIFSPFAQSDEIKAIVGANGENLTGELISQSSSFEGLKVAKSPSVELNIGDIAEIEAIGNASQQLAQEVYDSAQDLVLQAKAMQPLRESLDTQKQAQCITRMRELQPRVEALSQKAQPLSQQYVFLKASITALEIGVTCDADISPAFIEDAESNLRQASELFQ